MDRLFRIGEVADAVGIERSTLLGWAQRGYFPFLDGQREQGDSRKWSLLDVAYTAAFAGIAGVCGGGGIAASILQQSIAKQHVDWPRAVELAISGKPVYLVWKRGVGRPPYDVMAHLALNRKRRQGVEELYARDSGIGFQVGEDPGVVDPIARRNAVASCLITGVVSSALKAISSEQ